MCEGFASVGATDNNAFLIFSELLDASSLILTGNADTVYYMNCLDLTDGPVVIEQPTGGLGTINDMWFSWVIDVGFPGPESRGLGGKYLIGGPGYDGPLPEGGYFIARSKTNRVLYAMQSFIKDGSDQSRPPTTSSRTSKFTPTPPAAGAPPSRRPWRGP